MAIIAEKTVVQDMCSSVTSYADALPGYREAGYNEISKKRLLSLIATINNNPALLDESQYLEELFSRVTVAKLDQAM